MTSILLPREGSKWVVSKAKDVRILNNGVKKVSEFIQTKILENDKMFYLKSFTSHPLNPSSMDESALEWVFFVDVLNFSFWSDNSDNKAAVKWENELWTGYWSLCAAVNRALAEGKKITSAAVFSKITKEQLEYILRSDTDREIPLLDKRVENLHQAGKVIMENYNGSFVNMVKAADKSAMKLLNMVVTQIESFRDTAVYEGKQIALYKRAQILIADIWASCEGRGLGEFIDIDELTMFADYRIPQVLCWLGVLEYSSELMEKLKSKHVFKNGDREEVELRAASIMAVEMIVQETKNLLMENEGDYIVNASVVDFYLWEYRREKAKECDIIPFHRCRCIYY